MANYHIPHGTPNPPQWNPNTTPEEFLEDYDYWCVASRLQDEDVLAAKFAYSFMGDTTLRRAVQSIYKSTQTWAEMRRQCLQLLRECSNNSDGDYESSLASFESQDNYQKYNETITMFSRRWAQAYDLFARARATHGLAAWNNTEQLLEFRKRLVSEMHNLVLKKKGQIRNIATAVRVIREREQFNRDSKRAQAHRAQAENDPNAAPLNPADSFASRDGGTESGPRGRSGIQSASLVDRRPFPLAPARTSIHGAPDGQIESNATIRTKLWAPHQAAMESAFKQQQEKMREYEKKFSDMESKLTLLSQGDRQEGRPKEEEEAVAKRASELRVARLQLSSPTPSPARSTGGFTLPFPPENMPTEYKVYVAVTDKGQECLWCRRFDHNTQTCPTQCSRCAGPHIIYVCPTPARDFKCGNCGITGHCIESCVWRKIGSLKDSAQYGAQPPPKQKMHQQQQQRGFQQQHQGGFQQQQQGSFQHQPPSGSYANQTPPGNRAGHSQSGYQGNGRGGGHGGYNRNKRPYGQLRQAASEDGEIVQGGNFQSAVMNKKLKEHSDMLLKKIKASDEARQREQREGFERITKLIQSNSNNPPRARSRSRAPARRTDGRKN